MAAANHPSDPPRRRSGPGREGDALPADGAEPASGHGAPSLLAAAPAVESLLRRLLEHTRDAAGALERGDADRLFAVLEERGRLMSESQAALDVIIAARGGQAGTPPDADLRQAKERCDAVAALAAELQEADARLTAGLAAAQGELLRQLEQLDQAAAISSAYSGSTAARRIDIVR